MKKPNYTDPVKFTSTNNYGCGPRNEDDVYTIEEWKDQVDTGGFVDYDGHGRLVKDGLADSVQFVKPSHYSASDNFNTWDATHIVWMNR